MATARNYPKITVTYSSSIFIIDAFAFYYLFELDCCSNYLYCFYHQLMKRLTIIKVKKDKYIFFIILYIIKFSIHIVEYQYLYKYMRDCPILLIAI